MADSTQMPSRSLEETSLKMGLSRMVCTHLGEAGFQVAQVDHVLLLLRGVSLPLVSDNQQAHRIRGEGRGRGEGGALPTLDLALRPGQRSPCNP
jgi:hypothetical protein